MGRIKSKTQLTLEQFPDQKDWIGKLFYVLNAFITDVIAQVNGNLVFDENITGVEREVSFEYVSDTVSLPLVFAWGLSKPPKALYVVYAYESTPLTTGAPVALAASWFYTADAKISVSGLVRLGVSGATALTAGQTYFIRFRVTP